MVENNYIQTNKNMSYARFFLMMITSFLIMYLIMFLNMDDTSHYHTSLTRIYMALLMMAPMPLLMMAMMAKMYPKKKLNVTIMLASAIIFFIAFFALRTQTPVGDIQYMKAMIPHHSSAIMTSKHAQITDPEVKRLSQQIIESQQREIDQMEEMINRLSGK
jgi:uncharacterized protein (DUF305 family)